MEQLDLFGMPASTTAAPAPRKTPKADKGMQYALFHIDDARTDTPADEQFTGAFDLGAGVLR